MFNSFKRLDVNVLEICCCRTYFLYVYNIWVSSGIVYLCLTQSMLHWQDLRYLNATSGYVGCVICMYHHISNMDTNMDTACKSLQKAQGAE